MREALKYKFLLSFITLSVLPLFFIVQWPSAYNTHNIALYFSALFGYIGLVLLIWMYILGAKSVIGLYFKDMISITRLHKWLGKYGTILVFLHPILLAIVYRENILSFTFFPSLATNFDKTVTYGRIALIAMLIIWITSAVIRSKITFRPWKYIHYLAYIALPLSLLHIPGIGRTYQNEPAAQLYFYSILAIFVIFSILRIRQLFGFGKLRYQIVSNIELSQDVMLLKIKQIGNKHIFINPGQYVYLQPMLLSEEHPFSVLEANEKTGEVIIAYKIFGRFTKKLSQIQPGEIIYMDGPYGVFTQEILESPEKPVIFIAAGVGITPFVGHIMRNSSLQERWLFYASKTPQTATFGPVLKKKLPGRMVSVFSQSPQTLDKNTESGRIDAKILSKYLSNPAKYEYFICGPSNMAKSTKNILLSLKVPPSQIHTEAFGW